MARSFAYLGVDLVLVAALFAASQIIESKAPVWLAVLSWPLYWFFQVSNLTRNRLFTWSACLACPKVQPFLS